MYVMLNSESFCEWPTHVVNYNIAAVLSLALWWCSDVQYLSQQALVDDIELMFKNARHYNEENSQVYKDADTLARLLHSRVRTLAPIDDLSKTQQRRCATHNTSHMRHNICMCLLQWHVINAVWLAKCRSNWSSSLSNQ